MCSWARRAPAKGVRRVDLRTHPTGPDALEYLPHPASQLADLVTHISSVRAFSQPCLTSLIVGFPAGTNFFQFGLSPL